MKRPKYKNNTLWHSQHSIFISCETWSGREFFIKERERSLCKQQLVDNKWALFYHHSIPKNLMTDLWPGQNRLHSNKTFFTFAVRCGLNSSRERKKKKIQSTAMMSSTPFHVIKKKKNSSNLWGSELSDFRQVDENSRDEERRKSVWTVPSHHLFRWLMWTMFMLIPIGVTCPRLMHSPIDIM